MHSPLAIESLGGTSLNPSETPSCPSCFVKPPRLIVLPPTSSTTTSSHPSCIFSKSGYTQNAYKRDPLCIESLSLNIPAGSWAQSGRGEIDPYLYIRTTFGSHTPHQRALHQSRHCSRPDPPSAPISQPSRHTYLATCSGGVIGRASPLTAGSSHLYRTGPASCSPSIRVSRPSSRHLYPHTLRPASPVELPRLAILSISPRLIQSHATIPTAHA